MIVHYTQYLNFLWNTSRPIQYLGYQKIFTQQCWHQIVDIWTTFSWQKMCFCFDSNFTEVCAWQYIYNESVLVSVMALCHQTMSHYLNQCWPRLMTSAIQGHNELTHLPHIYASVKWVSIDSDNGLSPGRCQPIIWTNTDILSIRTQGTYFNEILFEIQIFSFKKMHLNMSSAKWRPFFPGENKLMIRKYSLKMSNGSSCIMIWMWYMIHHFYHFYMQHDSNLIHFISHIRQERSWPGKISCRIKNIITH